MSHALLNAQQKLMNSAQQEIALFLNRNATTTLYDRDEQVAMLRGAFSRRWPLHKEEEELASHDNLEEPKKIRCRSPSEFVLISGGSGTGKTFLARHVMKQLLEERQQVQRRDNKMGNLTTNVDVGTGGYCVLGKFDQLSRQGFNIPVPYGAFVAALTELALLWQKEGSRRLQYLHKRLDAHFEAGVEDETWSALRSLVPALECVFRRSTINNHSESPKLLSSVVATNTPEDKMHPSERLPTQKKLKRAAPSDQLQKAIREFILVTFSPAQPMVMLLDDLQWADVLSLELLEALTSDPDLQDKCAFVGICRSNEVPFEHAFANMLRRLEDDHKTIITNVQVGGLSRQATAKLVVDTLNQNGTVKSWCEDLVDTIYKTTEGNVFFILQLLKSLTEERIVDRALFSEKVKELAKTAPTLDPEGLCDITAKNLLQGQVQEELTVKELVLRRLKRLPLECQDMLKTAACLGAEFDRGILLTVLMTTCTTKRDSIDCSQDKAVMFKDAIELAVQEQLIHPRKHRKEGVFAFSHDQIQQSAYALIADGDHAMVHFYIGRALYKSMSNNGNGNVDSLLDDNIFLVVNQLIRGASLLETDDDKNGLALMCLRAGRKATQSSGFPMAAEYLRIGKAHLPGRPWRDEYPLCLELSSSLAEAECGASSFETMEETIKDILANARNEQDKFRAYTTKVFAHAAKSQLKEAVDLGIEVVARFDEKFPRSPNLVHVIVDLTRIKWRLRKMSEEDLLNLPTISVDRHDKICAMKMLFLVTLYTFLADSKTQSVLFPLITLRGMNLALKYGLCAVSPAVFATFGALLVATGDIDSGIKFGVLGRKLLFSRFQDQTEEWLPRIDCMLYGALQSWKLPFRSSVDYLAQAIVIGRRTGDTEQVAMAVQLYCVNLFESGKALQVVISNLVKYLDLLASNKQGHSRATCREQLKLMRSLSGEHVIDDPLEDTLPTIAIHHTYLLEKSINALVEAYFLGRFVFASEMAYKSRDATVKMKPVYRHCVQLFFDAMTSTEMAWLSKKRRRKRHARKCLKTLEALERHCPNNLHHKTCLIKAELMLLSNRLKPNATQCMDLFEEAIKSATEEGALHIRALSFERAGVALRRMGVNENRARGYLVRARDAYKDWGAHAVVALFPERYCIPVD